MALSGSSTLEEAKAQYLANARYAAENDTTKAGAFVEACHALLLLLPKRVKRGRGGFEVEMDPMVIERSLRLAEKWLQASGSAGSVVRTASFQNFR